LVFFAVILFCLICLFAKKIRLFLNGTEEMFPELLRVWEISGVLLDPGLFVSGPDPDTDPTLAGFGI
jgi:hypothetical protein